MTRKEEITNKARIKADQYSHPVEWDDCYHHWIEGAEWADETMIEKVCKFIEENAYKYGKVKFVNDGLATFDFKTHEFINTLKEFIK